MPQVSGLSLDSGANKCRPAAAAAAPPRRAGAAPTLPPRRHRRPRPPQQKPRCHPAEASELLGTRESSLLRARRGAGVQRWAAGAHIALDSSGIRGTYGNGSFAFAANTRCDLRRGVSGDCISINSVHALPRGPFGHNKSVVARSDGSARSDGTVEQVRSM